MVEAAGLDARFDASFDDLMHRMTAAVQAVHAKSPYISEKAKRLYEAAEAATCEARRR